MYGRTDNTGFCNFLYFISDCKQNNNEPSWVYKYTPTLLIVYGYST